MHREITYGDQRFDKDDPLALYALTGLLGLLLAADLWPILVTWLGSLGTGLPTWPNEVGGYRIALAAALLGGARALYGSLDALLAGRVGADLALALAAVAAILLREPLVAAEVVFIGLLGECLEHLTFQRAQHALCGLVELQPRRCWRLRDGMEERVRTTELQVGDVVVVKPGGRVPVDGVVQSGRSTVDVSALTGESLPQDKGPGEEVLAGSLNHTGALVIEARKVANETLVGRVIDMTMQALKDKSPLERTADRLARWFLPAVLLLALVTFLAGMLVYTTAWFRSPTTLRLGLGDAARLSVYPALSVLVVACPCALILATPAAVIAALGRLAGTGILIKRGSVLERLAEVGVIAFDKTGTLTEGRLQLGEVVPLGQYSEDELLRIAASVEQRSEHLLARLVVEDVQRRGLTLEPILDFQAHPGSGVSGRLGERSVLVGNARLVQEQGIALNEETSRILERLDATGQTVLLVCIDGVISGAIGARDQVRPEAAGMLAQLHDLGIQRLAMLTGDRQAVAQVIARELETERTTGLLEVHAGLLPEQKAEWVVSQEIPAFKSQIPNPGRARVAMVGDGINDALALAHADVGIAIASTSNDLPAEAGDIVLFGTASATPGGAEGTLLQALPFLVRLSRQTVAIIRQNILVFAFGVNLVGVVLTAWLWPILLPATWFEQGPVAAVIYHQVGSLAVLLNSMRLLWFERLRPTTDPGSLLQRFNRFNAWLDRWFNLDEWLHQLMHHGGKVMAVVAILAVLVYLMSGLTQVGPDEVGIVTRFGRPLAQNLEPGLSWRWPWPVERVFRVKPDRVQTVEVGFRIPEGTNQVPGASGWSTQHGQDGVTRVPEEAVMITGDGNLIELQGSIRFRIADPRVWLFEVRDGTELLRSATESVLRETVASHTFADLLTSGREDFQQQVLERLRQRVEGTSGIGIRIEGLSLQDMHPPQEVVESYHEVTRAMEQRDRRVNEAAAEAQTKETGQKGVSLETVRKAAAEKFQTITLAEAEAQSFLYRWQTRQQLGLRMELQLLADALAAEASGQPAHQVVNAYRKQRQQMQHLQATVTDFRLYWEMLRATLEGRDKIIVDADKVPGRRHLWLLPPEMFAPPAVVSPRGSR